MKIKMMKTLNDTLHEGRITNVAKDVAKLLIKQGDAEAYTEQPLIAIVSEPEPEPKAKK